MNGLNALLRNAARGIMWLLAGWSPLAVLLLISIGLGIVMAVSFRFTSNQRKLRRLAELSRAEVLAIRLFKDEPVTMFHALGRLLRHSAKRLWYSLPPMLAMFVPFVLLLTQLSLWYEHRPLQVGDSAVVELQLDDDVWTQHQNLELAAPPALAVETKPLRDDMEKTIWWRVRAVEPMPAVLRWRVGAQEVEKEVAVAKDASALMPVSSRRPGAGWWDRILYPGENALGTASPVRGIRVYHEPRSTPIFGRNVPWWLTLFAVSFLTALMIRPLVRVQF